MRKLDWKETVELLGIIGILASLIFVAKQLQQQEELLQVELRTNFLETYTTVNEHIIANVDIWIRGNAGEELTAAEHEIYERVFTNFNDFHFQQSQISRVTGWGTEDQAMAMFAGFLARNPGAYRVWIERERQINADRIAIDPKETLTSDWIDSIESRIEIIANSTGKMP